MNNLNVIVMINGTTMDSWPVSMWSDLHLDRNHLYLNFLKTSNPILKKLFKLSFSNRINSKFSFTGKSFWSPLVSINKKAFSKSKKNILVFESSVKFPPFLISKIKKYWDCDVLLYLPDTVNSLGIATTKAQILKYQKEYHIDKIISFDPKDCCSFDFLYFDIFSSSFILDILGNEQYFIDCDLSYVGTKRSNDREMLINSIYTSSLLISNFKASLILIDKKSAINTIDSELGFSNGLPYSEVIKKDIHSNCLLEIINPGQTGCTFKMKEAIILNKKLLTNNISVKYLPFYNPNYIHIFNDVSDIDFSWVKKKESVEYNYDNRFSPINLFSKLYK